MPGSLAARDISKSYAAVQVLDHVSLVVAPGDRVGIVGPNGIGKSTLLRVLAGLEPPDAGRVISTGAVGYLARRTGVGAAELEMDGLAARLADEHDLAGAYTAALDRFLALGGEDFDARAASVLDEVGLGRRSDRELRSLSGGEAARAALAAILLSRFDIFLLDEPTNNLDFSALEQLEQFLRGLAAGVVLVSHDRDFLDRTINRVVEFEAETRRVHEYAGSWSQYEAARTRARQRHETAYATYVGERDRYSLLLSERRTQARAGGAMADRRGTNALRGKVDQARNHLERLEEVEKPWSPWQLQMQFASAPPTGTIAQLAGAVVEIGSFTLGPVDLELHFGDRLAIVGANGVGKTTLIRALTGELPLARGSRRVGPAVVFGELTQARDLFSGVLLDDFAELSGFTPTDARTLLAKFALGHEDVARPAPSLSPGERTRAGLALLAARGVNCLILDEPTNHLDLEAIEELETALATYEGCLVVVTHDRRFLAGLSVTRTMEL